MKSQLKKKFEINAGIVALALIAIGLPSVYFATTSQIGSYTTNQQHASGFNGPLPITDIPSSQGSLTPPSKEAGDKVAKDSQDHLLQLNNQLNGGQSFPSTPPKNYTSCSSKYWINWSGDYYRYQYFGYAFAEMDMLVDYYQHWITCGDGNGFGGFWVNPKDTQNGYFNVGDNYRQSGWRSVSPFGGYNYATMYAGSLPGHYCIQAITSFEYPSRYYYFTSTPRYCY